MRQQVSIDDIKDRLLAQVDAVVHRYAPPASGSHTTHGRYFTLNPGRSDRRVGSFCIRMGGAQAGRWNDYASGQRGDILDLIRLACHTDAAGAIREARAYLGLDTESPELRRQRERAAAEARARRARDEARRKDDEARARKRAAGLWLSGQEAVLGTPVDHYLRARGIDLHALPHPPRAIRYHPECRYYYEVEEVDPATGEVRSRHLWRPLPAMVTAIARGAEIVDCHRTYLSYDDARGIWTKAPVPFPKKVFADYTGGTIRLCGEAGPRGGELRLKQAPAGARVWITEGIENALSLMMIRRMRNQAPGFVVAAGSIWNMSNTDLPDAVAEVVLVADSDEKPEAQEMLRRAEAYHQGKGRIVRTWKSPIPGEDLNDALRRALAQAQEQGAA